MKRTIREMVKEARIGMEQQHERGLRLLEVLERVSDMDEKHEVEDVLGCGHKYIMSETIRHPEGARWECLLHGLLEIIMNNPSKCEVK